MRPGFAITMLYGSRQHIERLFKSVEKLFAVLIYLLLQHCVVICKDIIGQLQPKQIAHPNFQFLWIYRLGDELLNPLDQTPFS